MNVQVLINKFSCANEVYKIAIIRWRIGGNKKSDGLFGNSEASDDVTEQLAGNSVEGLGEVEVEGSGGFSVLVVRVCGVPCAG